MNITSTPSSKLLCHINVRKSQKKHKELIQSNSLKYVLSASNISRHQKVSQMLRHFTAKCKQFPESTLPTQAFVTCTQLLLFMC